MQITYTEYQRAEQPIADFITHLLLVIKKIASPFVLEYRQWGLYAKKTTAVEKIVLPVTSTFLRGSVTDGGNGNNSYGIDPGLNVYGPSGGVSYICLCKA